MTRLLNQVEVEREMYAGGIKRAEGMMEKAERKGRAVQNPYAKELLDEYVMPLARVLNSELDPSRAGIRKAHAVLLGSLDPETVAALAVRTCINHILTHTHDGGSTLRTTATVIGITVHRELVLEQIADHSPELYHTLTQDFNRRMSKDERHRMTVYKMQARKAGIDVVEWPLGARDQVGIYLLGLLEVLGLVDIEPDRHVRHRNTVRHAPRAVSLTDEVMDQIKRVKSFVALTMPMYGPCVEQPKDWVTQNDGGFHTAALRRQHSTLVRHRSARSPYYAEAAMSVVLKAANALQQTRWQVNTEVLDVVLRVAKHFSVGAEVVSPKGAPQPTPPAWLKDTDTKEVRESWPEKKKTEFQEWKWRMAEWYTAKKLAGAAFSRFYSATRTAEMFRDYPAIFFVYFADSRGRLYPMTYGLNPQGSDLQRGLIRFAEGMPLDNPTAEMWFCVQGANKWGFDKATLEERQAWVMDREDLILSFAADPVGSNGWKDAGDPIQFLAWCLEFARWRSSSTTFKSHLPISMDGSCNGLQNLSALLRDEIGGEATNLTSSPTMQDIYRRVAEAATSRLAAATFEPTDPRASLQSRWLSHGISRDVVKRSVMTTPYGVTKRAAIDYVIDDYLKPGKAGSAFAKNEWHAAATLLMEAVWPAIGDVVVKGRECMDWLRKASRTILKDAPDQPITWTSPSGFPALQSYWELEVHRIRTRLQGPMTVRVVTETDTPDASRHANGLAPNFVHSMDAAHLHLTTAACYDQGIRSLAMIHDDYGTHAANAQTLYETIRRQFVDMYEACDPIAEFKAKYPGISKPPTKGSLDIQEVLTSRYFFS